MLGLVPAALGQAVGRVAGAVTDADGEALGGMNVYLEGSARGAASGADGRYEIERVPVGTYTLVASGVGYRAQRRTVTIRADATTTADFAFDATHLLLPEVEVIGRRQTTYTSAYTFAATRTAIGSAAHERVREEYLGLTSLVRYGELVCDCLADVAGR